MGREREVHDIAELLGRKRLITLIGPGGVGKTRLSLRSARASQRHFADRTCLVELSSLRDPELLPNTVAAALGLS